MRFGTGIVKRSQSVINPLYLFEIIKQAILTSTISCLFKIIFFIKIYKKFIIN